MVLQVPSAEAQTDGGGGNSGYAVALTTQTVTRTLPNGQTYVPRPTNLGPTDINFQDCEENVTLDFDITETVPSAVGSTDVLQVWAGPATTDCTSPTARETPGPFCWQVAPELEPTPGTSVTVAIAARSITEYLELSLSAVPGGGGVVGGPNLPESACHTQTSSGPVAVVIYFMFLAPGSSTVDASATYPLNADLVGPLAPTAVTAGIGDGVLIVDWTPQVDPNIQGFYIYAEDQGPKGTAGATDAGATLENNIYCHNGAEGGAGGTGDYTEVLDATSLEALGDAGLAARGCERAFPVSAFTAPGLDGGSCSSHALVNLFSTGVLAGEGGTTEVAGGVGISTIDYARYGAATVGVGTTSEPISTIPTADGGTMSLVDGHQYAVAVAAYDQDGNVGLVGPLVCQTPEPIQDFFGAYNADGGQGGGGFCSIGKAGGSGERTDFVFLVAAAGLARLLRRRERSRSPELRQTDGRGYPGGENVSRRRYPTARGARPPPPHRAHQRCVLARESPTVRDPRPALQRT